MTGFLRIDLFILRHAIAQPHGTPGVAENERALTADGKVKMGKAAHGLKFLQPDFDRVLSSPLKRAWQTAEIVKRVYGHEERIERSPALLPGGTLNRLLETLRESHPDDAVLLVGHQPHLGEIVSQLVWGSVNADVALKKGGVCHLEVSLGPRTPPRATFRWLLTPRQLRLLGNLS